MSEINEETSSIGVFCVCFDVDMARQDGWTEPDIRAALAITRDVVLATNKAVAQRRWHTRQCPDCECWTVPNGPCHLCEADKAATSPPGSVVQNLAERTNLDLIGNATALSSSDECYECTQNGLAVELPCLAHCPPHLVTERERRFGLVIAGLPTDIYRRAAQRDGEWTAW